MITDAAKSRSTTKISKCLWWQTLDRKRDFVIISSLSGSVKFVDLNTRESKRVKCRVPILDMRMVQDSGARSSVLFFLLILMLVFDIDH